MKRRRLNNTTTGTATCTTTKGNQPPQQKQQRRACHKRAPLAPGCFPNTDVSRGYIAVKDFRRFFPGAVPGCSSNSNNGNRSSSNSISGEEEGRGSAESENSTPQVPPELDISELRPITYKDYITQTIQESLKNTSQKPKELVDELFVKKDSKYHIIKEEDLGDTVAARLCGYENIEDAHLPRLKTLDFIKKLEGYYKESKKERAEKSADGRRNSKRDDNRRGAIEVDDDDDDEGSEDNDEEEDEEEEEEEEEDGIEDESTKEREINLQSDSTDTTTVTTTTEDGGDDSDSDSDNEGRRRRNTVSKKYTRMVRCIRRCGVPSATVNAKALRSSLARLAKSSTDRKTESATTITEEEEEEKEKESTDNPANKEKEEAERHEAVEPGDVVLRVTFYNKSSAKSQEFYVLGSQRLVELRDAIDCTVDHLERSNEANAGYEGQSQSASVKFFKSASFLIENVFYNDMRDSSNADYGKPVTVWAEKLRRRLHIKDGPSESSSSGILGPYKSEDMSKTRFSDLNIRLGVSYAYLHQADCEHRFVFSEIHLVSKGDDTNRLHYPLVAFKVKSNCKKCDVCRMFPGVLITYDDRYAPQVPAYWCMECYNRFHFGASGQKSYHYKALPYIYDFT